MNDNTVTHDHFENDDHGNDEYDYANDDVGDDGCHEEQELEIGAAGQHAAGMLTL